VKEYIRVKYIKMQNVHCRSPKRQSVNWQSWKEVGPFCMILWN